MVMDLNMFVFRLGRMSLTFFHLCVPPKLHRGVCLANFSKVWITSDEFHASGAFIHALKAFIICIVLKRMMFIFFF